jgi:hypothetical protein
MKKRRPDSSEITVGDHQLIWSIAREPSWCNADLWQGLAISVRLASGSTRELLIQYPMAENARGPDPRLRPGFTTGELQQQVRRAIDEGWDPQSRGKTYIYTVRDDA